MYGTVSCVNCRKVICKLKPCERLKSGVGVFLAKDFIPFIKNQVSYRTNYHHFHILVNCPCFKLTAGRNNISNEDEAYNLSEL